VGELETWVEDVRTFGLETVQVVAVLEIEVSVSDILKINRRGRVGRRCTASF
jgi:hypothetical protein